MCTQALQPFVHYIPVDIEGRRTGESLYEYSGSNLTASIRWAIAGHNKSRGRKLGTNKEGGTEGGTGAEGGTEGSTEGSTGEGDDVQIDVDELLQNVAEQSTQFVVKHLRFEGLLCYWEELLKRYAAEVLEGPMPLHPDHVELAYLQTPQSNYPPDVQVQYSSIHRTLYTHTTHPTCRYSTVAYTIHYTLILPTRRAGTVQ
jgi:hypothetical protein